MATSFKLQEGWDETPLSLDVKFAGYFGLYIGTEMIATVFYPCVEQIEDGDRNFVDIGLPYLEVTLFRVSREEFDLLQALDTEVSITCLNQQENVYQTFNAKMKPLKANMDKAMFAHDILGGFEDVTITFYDLELQ